MSSSSSSSNSPETSFAAAAEHDAVLYDSYDDVLEDLSSRFILNLPDEEFACVERICFQVEQAHWYYEDFIRESNSKLPSLPLRKFSAMLFKSCPMLQQWADQHEDAFERFLHYKTRVPVCGAIMLNSTWDKCVLVKGWKSSSGWGFPKGKINEDESTANCATREVLEETGYNLAGQIQESDAIEMTIKEQRVILYVVPGVSEDYPFKTHTRKEIGKIEWFKLSDLPSWKRNKTSSGKFYLIQPFISPLKAFIHDRKPRNVAKKNAKQSQERRQHPARQESQAAHQDSSSQSSSADADPQTPSPQWSEPQAQVETVPAVEPDDGHIDPHITRLLNALALSGPSHVEEVKEEDLGKTPNAERYVGNRNVLPQPAKMLSPQRSVEFHNAASPVKPPSQQPTPDLTQRLIDRPPSTTPIHSAPPNSQVENATSEPAPSPSTNEITSPKKYASRRTSSTADIAPYLTKAPEMPVSGRSLRHLALLECVASEAQSPLTTARAASAAPLERPHQANGHPFPVPPRPQFSVPPQEPFAPQTRPSYLNGPPMSPMYDAFQVRPPMQPSIPPSRGLGPQVPFPGLGQATLYSTGPAGYPRTMEPTMGPIPHHRSMSLAYGHQHDLGAIPRRPSHPEFAKMPVGLAAAPRSPLYSAAPRPHQNNPLLSILNGSQSRA